MKTSLKLILIASLALNLLAAGMVFGHLSHRFIWQNGFYHERMAMAEQLPENKRKLFRDAMHGVWQDTQSMRAQLEDARLQSAKALKAEPFNEQAYITQVQHMNDLHAQMKLHMAQAMAAFAKQLTPDERAVLAEIITHGPADKPGEGKADKY